MSDLGGSHQLLLSAVPREENGTGAMADGLRDRPPSDPVGARRPHALTNEKRRRRGVERQALCQGGLLTSGPASERNGGTQDQCSLAPELVGAIVGDGTMEALPVVHNGEGGRACRIADTRRQAFSAWSRGDGIGLLGARPRRYCVALERGRTCDARDTRERTFGPSRGGVRFLPSTSIRVSRESLGDAAGDAVTRSPSRGVATVGGRDEATTSLALCSVQSQDKGLSRGNNITLKKYGCGCGCRI